MKSVFSIEDTRNAIRETAIIFHVQYSGTCIKAGYIECSNGGVWMSGGKLFVVDDNPRDIRFIEEAFISSELTPTIHTVNTRDEALDLIHQRNEYEDTPRPDVVLLDWRLSQTTGKEVLDAAKSVSPPIPVVIMTSSKPQIESEKALVSRADQIIEKPTEPEKYVELLRPYLTGQ